MIDYSNRVRVVLQSRLSSSRLPAKSMLWLNGFPIVILAALRAGNRGTEVLVATSTDASDDVIAHAVSQAGIEVYRGSLEDPLDRFASATTDLEPNDTIVRLTADNVIPDGELVNDLVTHLHASGRHYARLGGDDPSLPYGVAAEAFSVASLREADKNATASGDREHVTSYIRHAVGDQRLDVPSPEPAWARTRCTVDSLEDYVALSKALHDVPHIQAAGWRDLCDRVARTSPAPVLLPCRRDNALNQGPLLLGTVQLGTPYGIANTTGMPSLHDGEQIVREARALGVTHLDTARAYGASEQRLGQVLRSGLNEHLGIITKVEPLPTSGQVSALHASVQTSLRHLRANSVNALLLHRAADWHVEGVAEALAEYQAASVTTAIGVSVDEPAELIALLADARCGYVQLPFNVLDRRWLAPDVMHAIRERPDVVITARSVYLQGLLLTTAAEPWPGPPDGAEVIPQCMDDLVRELGRESRRDLCIAYVLGHDWITSIVVGAETVPQIHETATLVQRPPLTQSEIDHVRDVVPAGSVTLVNPSLWSK